MTINELSTALRRLKLETGSLACLGCGREIDYEVDGVNLDFNHYGVVNFKTPFSAEKQLCLSCAARVCNFVENSPKMDGGADK